MPSSNIVIIGSGVIGLTIAHALSDDPSLRITIIARDLPDDFDNQAWASPWAGANWSPMESYNERIYNWELHTFNKFWDMIPSGLVMRLPTRIYVSEVDGAPFDLWWKDIVRNFHILPSESLPPDANKGLAYDTYSVNPMFYLPWLKSELIARGVEFIRKHVASLEDAAAYTDLGGVIINATALGAKSLIGVEDTQVFPIKGQGIIVECPTLKEHVAFFNPKDPSYGTVYVIPRPGDGTAILGGTFLSDVWDTSTDFSVANSIFAQCAALAPVLNTAESRIISHRVGLRPSRRGGPRVEAEWVDLPLKGDHIPHRLPLIERKQLVIHAYGLGAAGYQRSWGVAEEVSKILNEHRS